MSTYTNNLAGPPLRCQNIDAATGQQCLRPIGHLSWHEFNEPKVDVPASQTGNIPQEPKTNNGFPSHRILNMSEIGRRLFPVEPLPVGGLPIYPKPEQQELDPLDPNVIAVTEKMKQRAKIGLKKYGVDTTRTDLSTLQWLQHAQDEAMDFSVYLQRLMTEDKQQKVWNGKARELISEVMQWHSDSTSSDYNDCDKNKCHWCEMAIALLAQIPKDKGPDKV